MSLHSTFFFCSILPCDGDALIIERTKDTMTVLLTCE